MKIISIGPFPNPLTGMSYINKCFFDKIKLSNKNIYKINTTYRSNKKDLIYILLKPFFIFKKICRLMNIITYRKTVVYLSLSHGYGKIFDLFFIIITVLFNCRCVIHHHSSNNFIKKSIVFKIIANLTNKKGLHICLTRNMQINLNKIYKIKNSIVLSNFFFLKKKKIKKKIKKKKHLKTL